MPFYEKGNVRIHFEDAGSGFPLLLIPGGGHNSTIAWNAKSAPFNPVQEFGNEYRCIKDTKDKIPLAVRQVRTFLRAHRPAMA